MTHNFENESRFLLIWNAADEKPVRELAGHELHIYNLAFHPDGLHLATAHFKGNVLGQEDRGDKGEDVSMDGYY